jgi:hypothetical protein
MTTGGVQITFCGSGGFVCTRRRPLLLALPQTQVLPSRLRPCRVGAIELGHDLAVGGAGGDEVVVAVVELELQVDDLLFAGGDSGLELFGAVGAADTGLAPDLLAQDLAEPAFEAPDLGGEAGSAGVGWSRPTPPNCARWSTR